ncbi:MAG: hypothetical protein ACOC0L_01300 [bacterium]
MSKKPYRITIFGKPGCDKCKVLNERIDKLLTDDKFADFEKVYLGLDSEDGLVEFCNVESINPQRIPAFVVSRFDAAANRYEPILRTPQSDKKEASNPASLYAVVGLQTDYSGSGTIPPRMITTVLNEARATS